MEPNLNSPLTQLVNILKETYTGGTQAVKQAEELLKTFSKEPTKFVDALIGIVVSDINIDGSLNIKDAACLHLCTFLQLQLREDLLKDDQKIYIINSILQTLYLDSVTLNQKNHLKSALEEMLLSDIGNNLRNQALVVVREKLGTKDIKNFAPSLYTFQAIITASHNKIQEVSTYYQVCSQALMETGAALVQGILGEIQKLNSENQEQTLTHLTLGLKILQIWAASIHDVVKYLAGENTRKSQNSHIQIVLTSESIVEIFSRILVIHIPTEKQLKGCVFSTSGFEQFDKQTNTVKSIVMRTLNKIIDFVFRTSNVLSPSQNKVWGFVKKDGIVGILQSVFTLCKTEGFELDPALEDPDLHENVVECLNFLAKLALQDEFYNIFSDYKKQLIVDVCLPLMRTTESEIVSFETSPDEFIYLAEDIVDKKQSETSKTQAALLLEHLCDNIDGTLTFVTVIAVNIIDYSLVCDNVEEIPSKFNVLTDYSKSVIISKTKANIRVETGLLVLSVMCYLIVKRPDLLNMIEKLLGTYYEFFLGDKSDPLIKARICLLFQYYAEYIFNGANQGELFKVHLAFLVNAVGIEDKRLQSFAQSAGNALGELFDDQDMVQKMDKYITDILERLAHYVDGLQSYKLFDIILDIVRSHDALISQSENIFLNLMKVLTTRAIGEYELVKSKQRKTKMYIHKIWNIFKAIADRRCYVSRYLEQIEKILSPFFAYLEHEPEVPFDDDILQLMGSTMRIAQTVTPTQWSLFKLFPKLFKKYSGLIEAMFAPLNYLIVFGAPVIKNDPDTIHQLIDMAIVGLNPTSDRANEANCADGALLLQVIIQYLSPISDEDWKKILVACMTKYADTKRTFLKARIAGVLLTTFLLDYRRTEAIFVENDGLNTVLDHIIGNLMIYKHHMYDRKLLVIGLSNFFLQENINQAVVEKFPKILDACITMLAFTKYIDQRNAKKAKQQEEDDDTAKLSDSDILYNLINNNKLDQIPVHNQYEDEDEFVDVDEDDDYDDDDDDDDDIDLPNDEETESNVRVDAFMTALKKEDEFYIFKDIMSKVKQHNPNALLEMANMLSTTKQEHFKQVVMSQRVVTDGKTQTRKIVKAKGRKVGETYNPNNNSGQ